MPKPLSETATITESAAPDRHGHWTPPQSSPPPRAGRLRYYSPAAVIEQVARDQVISSGTRMHADDSQAE